MSHQAPLQLPNKFTAPPGGWRYLVPETGWLCMGHSESEMVAKLTAHYKASGYPMPDDIRERIEYFVCERQPDYCVEALTMMPRFKTGIAHTISNVISFTRVMGTWIAKSRTFVGQDLANKRAATCAGCQFNELPQGCTGCNSGALRDIVERVVGNRKTTSDEQLKACAICSCQTRVKIWFPHSVLVDNMSKDQQEKLPAHCWLKTEAAP